MVSILPSCLQSWRHHFGSWSMRMLTSSSSTTSMCTRCAGWRRRARKSPTASSSCRRKTSTPSSPPLVCRLQLVLSLIRHLAYRYIDISKEKYHRYINISTYRWQFVFNWNFPLIQLWIHILYVFMDMFLEIYTFLLLKSRKKLENLGFLYHLKCLKLCFQFGNITWYVNNLGLNSLKF